MQYHKLSRREWLRLSVLGTVGALAAACQSVLGPPAGGSAPQPTKDLFAQGASTPAAAPTTIGGIPLTANPNFYTVSYRPDEPPQIPTDWKLTLTGQVDHPLSWTLDQLKALSSVTEMRTLECISNPVGGDLISNAIWKGVRLKDLLAQAGPQATARYLRLDSFDGYGTGIPIELAMDEHSLLVYEMNGEALPPIHGAPLRCLWPGRYGMKQPKWIQTITALAQPYTGYWEDQGWSNDAIIRPTSRIDSPQDLDTIATPTFTVSGIAMTNDSGLAKLEIGWDNTNEWHAAELTRGPSPYVWTLWKWTGPSLSPGRHTLYARATDNRGATQMQGQSFNMLGDTFPDGTADMHTVVLNFKSP